MIETVRVAGGKYAFDFDEYGLMVAARRHGMDWPEGFELRFTNCFTAALKHIVALSRAAERLVRVNAAGCLCCNPEACGDCPKCPRCAMEKALADLQES